MDVPLVSWTTLNYRFPETKPTCHPQNHSPLLVWPSTKGCSSDHPQLPNRLLKPPSADGSWTIRLTRWWIASLSTTIYVYKVYTNIPGGEWNFWTINSMLLSFSKPILESHGPPEILEVCNQPLHRPPSDPSHLQLGANVRRPWWFCDRSCWFTKNPPKRWYSVDMLRLLRQILT